MRQIISALSPSNFALTNPQVYRETIASNGENLVKGMKMLAEDIAAGHGDLRIRQTDMSKFAVGVNMAVTPGKVVAENDVCQIIQYDPTTEEVLKRPLLICPPWINKFYVLDLNRKSPSSSGAWTRAIRFSSFPGSIRTSAMPRRIGRLTHARAWTSPLR